MPWKILVIFMLIMPLAPSLPATPLAVQGRADLSAVDWRESAIVDLNGDWQFYWDQLLSPQQLAAGQGKLTAFLPLEQQWHRIKIPGVDVQRWGSATYQLSVHLPEGMPLMLYVPILNSASRIWINSELKQDFGILAPTQDKAEGQVRINLIPFNARAGENIITIQISNQDFWYGGASQPLRIGLPDAIHKSEIRASAQDAFSFGFILFMAIYHIYIRFLLKQSNGALFFGLTSLANALRIAFIGEGQIFYQLWSDWPLWVRYLVEYLGVAGGTAYALAFFKELFPHEAPKMLYRPPIYIALTWAIFIILTPARYYPMFLEAFQLIILYAGIIVLTTIIRAARHRRDGAKVLIVSCVLYFVCIINDILFHHNILASTPLVHYGLMVLMASQALILARRFAKTFDRAERAEHQVTRLNQSLEEKIVERTEQINTILAHARSGFLLVDRNGYLQTGFTSSCETILNRQLRVGESLPLQLGLNDRLKVQFMLAVSQIFDSDLPTEVALQQLPARFPIENRVISLQAAAVRPRPASEVSAVLLTINDVTDLVAAEEGLKRADVLIHILEDQDAFRIFLADFKKDLEAAVRAIKSKDSIALDAILHNMKGNAASFNLDDWVANLHRLEDQAEIRVEDILDVADHVRRFLKLNEGILHLDFDMPMHSVFGIDESDLKALRECLEPVASPVAITRVESWSRAVKALPLKSYTTALTPMVARVAQQLQKNVCLVVEGADTKVDNAFAPLLTTLPHLIRNALAHGIEDPEERGNKPAQATIRLRFESQADGGLCIEVSDDGRGLNVDQIRSHAQHQGLITESQQLSDKDILGLIFHPKFSTADQVTDLAGRGMGLAAVATAVQDLGGNHEIRSQKNQGFHLIIRVPRPDSAQVHQAS
jgi:signal transduction histidine kinase